MRPSMPLAPAEPRWLHVIHPAATNATTATPISVFFFVSGVIDLIRSCSQVALGTPDKTRRAYHRWALDGPQRSKTLAPGKKPSIPAVLQPFDYGQDYRNCDNPDTRSGKREASPLASPADPTDSAMGTVVSQPIPMLS